MRRRLQSLCQIAGSECLGQFAHACMPERGKSPHVLRPRCVPGPDERSHLTSQPCVCQDEANFGCRPSPSFGFYNAPAHKPNSDFVITTGQTDRSPTNHAPKRSGARKLQSQPANNCKNQAVACSLFQGAWLLLRLPRTALSPCSCILPGVPKSSASRLPQALVWADPRTFCKTSWRQNSQMLGAVLMPCGRLSGGTMPAAIVRLQHK